jgi:WhiB family redox-sensing transcriptional regulator
MSRHGDRNDRAGAHAMPPAVLTDEGACRGTDPEVFFPHGANDNDLTLAIKICHRCHVRELCLDWAVDTGQTHGVWGGTGPDERSYMIERARR